MITRLLSVCGRQGRWVLPMGLVAGFLLPWAAQPMRTAIPYSIATLLFLAVLRLYPSTLDVVRSRDDKKLSASFGLVLGAQLALPLAVFLMGSWISLPPLWLLAITLVAAAPPISGSPNLVLLLRGDGQATMRWLMLGTALLPLTCLPLLYLLFPGQPATIMIQPALSLLLIIGGSVLAAVLFIRLMKVCRIQVPNDALDGASAIVLAVIVIGLMSAVHAPDSTWGAIGRMLILAFSINFGLQLLGIVYAKLFGFSSAHTVTHGVVLGNRNIALFLTALPAAQIEPLLLFIACYQVPMYLTPLIGGAIYPRLE